MARRLVLILGAFAAVCVYQAGAGDPSCVPVDCDLSCEHGYSRNAFGCDICECQHLACKDVHCAVGKICELYTSDYDDHLTPEAMCIDPGLPDLCKHPMEKGTCSGSQMRWYYDTIYDKCEEFMYSGCHGNENRFSTNAECETACQPTGCSAIMCAMHCEFGFEKDPNGCDICKCRLTSPDMQGDEQPHVFSVGPGCDENAEAECGLSCQYGFRRDDRGCHVCDCHVPPQCAQVTCNNECQFGRRFDNQGCVTCNCRQQGECNSGIQCRMHCDFGFKEDTYGCPYCECAEDPCKTEVCPRGTACHLNESSTTPDVTCLIEDSWSDNCQLTQCMMHCEHGFQTDKFGCSVCECLTRSRSECPMRKCVPCHFGYAYDEQGCRSCDCLPDPCLEQKCQQNQVCETYRKCMTIECRILAKCTEREQILRAKVDITLIHSPIAHLDEVGFMGQFRQHMMALLGVEEDYIKGIKVTRRDNHTLAVDFHLLVEGDQDIVEDIQTFRDHLHADTDQATLSFQDTDFIPQPESLIATYHSSGFNEMENAPKSNTTVIIIVACVVGGLLLLILIAVVAAKITHRRDEKATPRKNIIYKKAGDTSQIA